MADFSQRSFFEESHRPEKYPTSSVVQASDDFWCLLQTTTFAPLPFLPQLPSPGGCDTHLHYEGSLFPPKSPGGPSPPATKSRSCSPTSGTPNNLPAPRPQTEDAPCKIEIPSSTRGRGRKDRTHTREEAIDVVEHARIAHTTVERRYRDNINLLLNQLRQTLTESEAFSKDHSDAAPVSMQWDSRPRKRKSDVLVDAINYIHETEVEMRHLRAEIDALAVLPRDILFSRSPTLGAYQKLCAKVGITDLPVAVRSSATAEDLPDASFAGQQNTFLNISGERALLRACRQCYASLFTDRAISYRDIQGFDHMKVSLSIRVQQMVRADAGGAGVMFSIDTESGFDKVVLINAAWGLGENVVQGTVNPDEYQVYKPLLENLEVTPIVQKKRGEKAMKMIYDTGLSPTRNVPTSKAEQAALVLNDKEILQLARWACMIEKHSGCPMDMEWAKDGYTEDLFIVQARPETVHSSRSAGMFKTYTVGRKGRILGTGLAVGEGAVAGRVCLIENAKDIDRFVDGSILVTEATDPDWVPVMKRAAAIVTDHGGRTSHAAIVSRELGLPALVCTSTATYYLHNGQDVTVSCAEGDTGFVYEGQSEITSNVLDISSIPVTGTKVMLNQANPSAAYRWWRLPSDGIGLARMEFVVSNSIRVHPMALCHFDQVKDAKQKKEILRLTTGYPSMPEYFVEKLSRGLASLCAAVYPKTAIIRLSDFKTNEYANLIGGDVFERKEDNPMLGFRGASRYHSPRYKDGFALECKAIKRLREELGFDNAVVMVPFCRTVDEARKVLAILADNGLKRGDRGLEVYVMCEIPSNVILASEFAQHFDGFSIGSNDLTQLTLGVDRDSGELADIFDERDDAVKWMIQRAIHKARVASRKIGLYGQAPSTHPSFAAFLVECGIDSVSVSPDSFLEVKKHIYEAEKVAQANGKV